MASIADEIIERHTHVNTFEPGAWPGRQRCPVRALVIHVMDGSWEGSIGWAHNPQSEASFNYGISKSGQIAEVVDPDTQAPWANGIIRGDDTDLPRPLADLTSLTTNANWVTISIELEGKPFAADFPTEVQYRTAARLAAWLCRRYGLTPTAETMLGHRQFSLASRPNCPGPQLQFDRLIAETQRELSNLAAEPIGLLTGESPLLGRPTATAEQAVAYLVGRGSVYNAFDLGVIVGHYWNFAPRVGLNPVLALAQSILETSARQADGRFWPLSSWWAQRPRRNPAGLGVTGEQQVEPPANQASWAFDEVDKLWRRGLSFSSWEIAAQAHIGRLLAYALIDAAASPAQQEMIAMALAFRSLPERFRGAAPALSGLNGRWAVPGEGYGEHIARIANEINAAGTRGLPSRGGKRRGEGTQRAAGQVDGHGDLVTRTRGTRARTTRRPADGAGGGRGD
jgi:N-acetyl-anhydromuramyl-L-alanine amidase AmpD